MRCSSQIVAQMSCPFYILQLVYTDAQKIFVPKQTLSLNLPGILTQQLKDTFPCLNSIHCGNFSRSTMFTME